MAPAISLANALAALLHAATPDTVAVDRDNIAIRRSCTLVFPATPVADADGNGVVHIEAPADGGAITVDLAGGTLTGGAGSPDAHTGIGIVVRGPRVTIRNGAVRGYKVGIRAEDCDGLVVEDIDTSGNYAQRLRSTPMAEFAGDWLYPHHNDEGQWIAQHGAGIAVRQAKGVVLRRITSHGTQNGIVLDRVTDSELYDNDCSFLSGWGIAMWRSSRNTICRNRLIYCIRGYSHGLYNRGQDSAGLLMFEQCCDNLVALNSITHGGDGVFGFAGREALGEAPCPSSAIDPGDPLAWHRGRGCNGNIFARNDLSFAAAHGLEMTFSSRNTVYGNILEGNAICGIWGGYARDSVITGNEFRANGGAGYGLERGGANLEHAQRVRLARNRFTDEPVSVHLWTDADEGLRSLPWARANGMGAADNSVANNTFTRVRTPVELRGARGTRLAGNTFTECGAKVAQQDCVGTTEMDAAEAAALDAQDGSIIADIDARLAVLPGSTNPTASRVGARGRADIVMGEFAPWNHRDAIMVPVAAKRGEAISPGVARFRVLGIEPGALRGDLIAVDAAGAADSPALTAALAGEHPDGGTVFEVRRASRDNALPSAVGTARPFTLRVRGSASRPGLEARHPRRRALGHAHRSARCPGWTASRRCPRRRRRAPPHRSFRRGHPPPLAPRPRPVARRSPSTCALSRVRGAPPRVSRPLLPDRLDHPRVRRRPLADRGRERRRSPGAARRQDRRRAVGYPRPHHRRGRVRTARRPTDFAGNRVLPERGGRAAGRAARAPRRPVTRLPAAFPFRCRAEVLLFPSCRSFRTASHDNRLDQRSVALRWFESDRPACIDIASSALASPPCR